MPFNYEETQPYVPGSIVIKLTNVPESLKKNERMHKAFVNLIENRSKNIGVFTTGRYLGMSEFSGTVPTYMTEDRGDEHLDIEIPEVKNKATSRLLRDVTKQCFIGKTQSEVKGDGFDLLVYELSEDQTTVIDAWKLSGFTFPNALGIASEFSRDDTFNLNGTASIKIPVLEKEPEHYCLSLSGSMYNGDEVLIEAMKAFKFLLVQAGKDSTILDRDLLELRGGGDKDA